MGSYSMSLMVRIAADSHSMLGTPPYVAMIPFVEIAVLNDFLSRKLTHLAFTFVDDK